MEEPKHRFFNYVNSMLEQHIEVGRNKVLL